MKITIKADEIKENSIREACETMSHEVDIKSNLGNRITQIANLTNTGVFDMIEAIATHIFYEDTDYIF